MGRFNLTKKLIVFMITNAFIVIAIVLVRSEIIHNKSLRVAYSGSFDISEYDTARIHTANQAMILRNLFSPLVEYTASGELVSGVAKKFYWIENVLHFEIDDKLFTNSGTQITAEDVYVTIKRLLVLDTNTHGQLKYYFCGTQKWVSIEESCNDLILDGSTVKIVVSRNVARETLLPLLAASDFGVIPKSSINFSNKKMPITNYSETSGPYFVDRVNKTGEIVLLANKHHYHYSESIPQRVVLVSSKNQDSIDMFRSGSVDLLTTFDQSRGLRILGLADKESVNLHLTSPIKIWYLWFLKRGATKLAVDERFYIGSMVRSIFEKLISNVEPMRSTIEFFPNLGEAGLDGYQRVMLESRLKAKHKKPLKKVVFEVAPYIYSEINSEKNTYENIAFNEGKMPPPWIRPESDQPDGVILWADGGFFENFSLVNYYTNIGVLDAGPLSKIWLTSYINTQSKSERLNKLRKIHFESLYSGSLIPIGASPFIAVVRKPYVPALYKHFAGTAFWMITNQSK